MCVGGLKQYTYHKQSADTALLCLEEKKGDVTMQLKELSEVVRSPFETV